MCKCRGERSSVILWNYSWFVSLLAKRVSSLSHIALSCCCRGSHCLVLHIWPGHHSCCWLVAQSIWKTVSSGYLQAPPSLGDAMLALRAAVSCWSSPNVRNTMKGPCRGSAGLVSPFLEIWPALGFVWIAAVASGVFVYVQYRCSIHKMGEYEQHSRKSISCV